MCTSNIEPRLNGHELSSRESPNAKIDERPQKTQINRRRKSWRLQKQQISSLLLDLATATFVIYFIYNNPSYLNPWNIPSAQIWLMGFIFIRCAIVFYDHLVVLLIEKVFQCKVLPTRQPGAPPVRYVELDSRSIVYLSINSLNEFTFVMRLTHYLWNRGYQTQLPWELSQISVVNTLVAIGIMFVSMDLVYAPLHHILHLPSMYPYIHKHHHRQHFPVRGYLDAGNEHPIEHMIGVMCTWFAVCTAEVLLPSLIALFDLTKSDGLAGMQNSFHSFECQGGGVHAATVLLFFQLHAALAMMNHSPFDAKFSLPFVGSSLIFGDENRSSRIIDQIPLVGKRLRRLLTGQWFKYSVGHHEMHHRKFNYNYGQYCMFYDRWMGTFTEYEGPIAAAELEARKKLKSK